MKDEHEGKGGSYVRDPKTGKRTLVERTEEAMAETPIEAKTEQPAKSGREKE